MISFCAILTNNDKYGGKIFAKYPNKYHVNKRIGMWQQIAALQAAQAEEEHSLAEQR